MASQHQETTKRSLGKKRPPLNQETTKRPTREHQETEIISRPSTAAKTRRDPRPQESTRTPPGKSPGHLQETTQRPQDTSSRPAGQPPKRPGGHCQNAFLQVLAYGEPRPECLFPSAPSTGMSIWEHGGIAFVQALEARGAE